VAAETKQKTFQALCDVIVDDRFALQERALAAGALAPLMESESTHTHTQTTRLSLSLSCLL
jgi:predicted 2-oxoglutarate/Fe(II)-dependent dioxygenase YbiX